MRASLIAAAAGLVLAGLAGCGEGTGPAAPNPSSTAPAASSSVDVAEPTGPVVDVTPTPPDGKPVDPPADPPAGAAPTAPVSLSPTGPVVPAGVEQVPSARVDVSAVPEYYEHRGLVWVYDGGRSLQMFAAASSGCGDAAARVVDQSAAEVRIVLESLPQPQGGSADGDICTTVMTPRPVTVALDAPLGTRTVVLSGGR